VHETAVVSADADVDPTAVIGPFAVVERDVVIGAGTVLGPHAVVRRFSRIGRDNVIDPGAVVGGPPQHTRFDGSETWVVLGDRNVLREGVTIHRAFAQGGTTQVGSGCYLMNNAHVGHDCTVGDGVVLTSGVVLGGHVEVGAHAVLGGYAGAHQFTRVGAFAMVAAYTALRKDVLPFSMVGGQPVRHYRLNTVGLRRHGLDRARHRALEAAFRALRRGDRTLDGHPETEEIAHLRAWLAARSTYGVYGFARAGRTDDADASGA
jgi:UDP-N-acetylglucosamine acyltransferase